MASPRYLLDTNVVIALVRGNELGRYLDATYGLSAPGTDPEVSIVTVGELVAFAGKAAWGAAKWAALAQRLTTLTAHDVDAQFVTAYGEIDTASHAIGHKMGKNDIWIAATARVRNLTLLTTDKDFDHLHPGWITLEWVDPNSKLPDEHRLKSDRAGGRLMLHGVVGRGGTPVAIGPRSCRPQAIPMARLTREPSRCVGWTGRAQQRAAWPRPIIRTWQRRVHHLRVSRRK